VTLLLVLIEDIGETLAILETGISGRQKVGVRPLVLVEERDDGNVYEPASGGPISIVWEAVLHKPLLHFFWLTKSFAGKGQS
jgi:hypothetical protein